MNRKYNVMLIAVLVIVMTSCTKELDKYPLDRFSEDKVWNTAEGAQTFLNATLYIKELLLEHADDWSDNTVVNAEMGTAVKTVRELMTNEDNYGWNKYADIRRCNLAIQKVSESTTIKDQDKAPLIAQAKFLRATAYFTRARMFGRLIIVDNVLAPGDNMMLPRTQTIKQTYDFILKDLEDAAHDLPVNVAQGALSKGAAYALAAEVAIHGAAYLESPTDKSSYYAIAKDASEKLFGLGIYQLEGDYKKLFTDYNVGLNSKEVILATYWLAERTRMSNTWMQGLVPNQGAGKIPDEIAAKWPIENFEGWLDKSPSQDLVDDYLVVDIDGKAKRWNETSYLLDYNRGAGTVAQAMYEHRDTRFYASIVYDGSSFFNSHITTRLGGNLHYLNNKEKDRHMTKTGYLYRKHIYEEKPVIASVFTNYHLISLRLGRSYLNYAEVLLRLGQIGEAIEYINRTRVTHGQLPPLDLGLSEAEAWAYYRIERRVELVQEADRYWSLLRWGKEDNLTTIPELNTSPTAIEISEDGAHFSIIPVPVVGPANERRFSAKRYLLPIPRIETIENEALANDQNEGWR